MAPSKSPFAAPKKAVDPTLDALFASSVGPVEAARKPKYEPLVAAKPRAAPAAAPVKPLTKEEEEEASEESEDEDSEGNGEEDEDEDDSEDDDEEDSSEKEEAPAAPVDVKASAGKRKRKNGDENDDLESRYFDKLEKEIDGPAEKKAKREADNSDEEMAEGDDDSDDGAPIIHESLLNGAGEAAADGTTNSQMDDQDKAKADRTVFLSNVSISAITNKAAKKTLMAHLESVADDKPAKGKKGKKDKEAKEDAEEEDKEKKPVLESLRFRSVPFASAALPKRASFITKAVMGATAQSTNAYAVYTTAAAARAAVRKLNGTVVLDRHLRADSVSHPSPVDHRRCVFVGNLGFVDDETVLSANPEADGDNGGGEMTRKKRNKTPMDIDEGLWRTFGKHAGKVESVRVIRDQATRVGKGFAYVQFYDATSVEAALLLADKKFPPLLPRALRVSRCKAPYKTARALERVQLKANGKPGEAGPGGPRDRRERREPREPRERREPREPRQNGTDNGTTGYKPKLTAEQQTSAGRASKLLGKSAATTPLGANGPDGKPIVFEGMRARVGGVNLFKKGKGKKNAAGGRGPPGKDASKKQVRQAERSAKWRASKGGPKGGDA